MARGSMGKLLKWGAIGAAAFYAYGYVSSHGLPGLGAGTASASGGSTPAPSGGCNPAFITGSRYVAPLPNGQFEVVVNGKQIAVFNSQSQAEQAYNKAVGCG